MNLRYLHVNFIQSTTMGKKNRKKENTHGKKKEEERCWQICNPKRKLIVEIISIS